MRFWVGVTDLNWFDNLRAERADEANFWRPSPRPLGPIPAGAPFAFKLKSPRNRIGGVGFFVNAWDVPLSMAWQAFATRNGFSDYAAFRAKILSLHAPDASPDPVIRCHALTDVTFFTDQEQFGPPEWSANIVSGRMFDTEKTDGARLWDELAARLANRQRAFSSESLAVGPRYGVPLLVKPRLGQGAFRFEVMEAYRRRCAVTGERTLPVLEAAHIRPYASEGPHALENGIFLRSDIHALFDLGYLTVRRDGGARDLRLVVSGRIRENTRTAVTTTRSTTRCSLIYRSARKRYLLENFSNGTTMPCTVAEFGCATCRPNRSMWPRREICRRRTPGASGLKAPSRWRGTDSTVRASPFSVSAPTRWRAGRWARHSPRSRTHSVRGRGFWSLFRSTPNSQRRRRSRRNCSRSPARR